MTTLSLQIPLVGQPNSTEDPKIASDMTAIQTWANGSVDDSNLSSPNNAVRRLLLQATGRITSTASAADFLIVPGGLLATGAIIAGEPPIWAGDQGLSGQPTDWQVAGKSGYCRVRLVVTCNTVTPAVTVTGKLYTITAAGGTGGNVAVSFAALTGSSTAVMTPAPLGVAAVESPQFAMPLSGSYALGVALSGAPAANCAMLVTAQLFGYNA